MNTHKKIKVCALTLYPYDTGPGQRFRIEQWEPFLKEQGIEIEYFNFADENLMKTMPQAGKIFSKISGLTRAFFRRLSHFSILRQYDVIFIYRTAAMVGPAFLERLIRLYRKPIILDFDDSIFLTHTAESNRVFGWAKFPGKTATICRLSKSVTVGNSFLAEYARQYNDSVYIVPTSIDINRFQPPAEKPENNGRVIVGWTGSSTSQTYLEAFEETLAELLKERDVEIRVLSDREPSFRQIPYVWRMWTAETEVHETSKMEIGIMPTPDDDWARGKCACKALQYMSLGIPAICSDVGANRDVIKHGENGFLAGTTAQWIESFKKLIDDQALRKRLGNEGRKTVVQNYSMRQSALQFADVVRKSLEKTNEKK